MEHPLPFSTKWALFLLGFIFYCFPVFPQSGDLTTLTGKVTNRVGEAIPGVTITVKGSTLGTVSDIDGNYRIQVPEQSTLVFSYIGFTTREEPIGSLSVMNIDLEPEIVGLEEIVVVGYGTQEQREVTGSTFSLKSKDFNQGIINSPEELIQGKIPGVDIVKVSGEPGSDAIIRIRGANTIRANNSPLIVVDGYPLDINNLDPPFHLQLSYGNDRDSYSPLTFINPDDIESIDVLKDASAAAIYGARGSNGVIIITTKKGNPQKTQLSYRTYGSVSQVRKTIDVLSADEFRKGQRDNGFDNIYSDTISTDWQDEVYQNAFTHNHDLSLSGGSTRTNYRTSLNVLDQEGMVRTSSLRRYGARANVRHSAIHDRLSIDLNINMVNTKHRQTGGPSSALTANPTQPVRDENGDFFDLSDRSGLGNPVGQLELQENIVRTNKLLGNLITGFEIIEGLNFKVNVGAENAVATRRFDQNGGFGVKNSASISENESGSFLIENYLTFQRQIKENHDFQLLAGYSYQEFQTKGFVLGVAEFATEGIPMTNILQAGTIDLGQSSFNETSKLQSFFTRANYGYKDRYLFTGTYRLDGSSRFGENNRYGGFPSLALGWRLSEEDFLKDNPIVDMLKLRASWGITGNQEIPNKISQYVLGVSPFGLYKAILDDSPYVQGYALLRTPNSDLKWEETRQYDIGIDFTFSDNRLSGSIDYFNKKTTDFLLLIPTSNAPTAFIWTNMEGGIINKGFEFLLSGNVFNQPEFSWNTSLTFTTINNDIQGLPSDIDVGFIQGPGIAGTPLQILRNGEAVGSFFGPVFQGFDEQGINILKKDQDSNAVEEVIGQGLPDFTWGLTNTFQFNQFDLSFLINGSVGNDIYNANLNLNVLKQSFPPGQNITREQLASEESFDNINAYSSRYIEDGSFIRLNYVTLGYNVNVSNLDWLNGLRVYLTGTNLFLISDYSGFDPEVNTRAEDFVNGIPTIGVDGSAYPRPRTYQLGLNVDF